MNQMQTAITDADIRAYRDDGVVCLRGLFSPEWVRRMYAATERVMQSGQGRIREGVPKGGQGRFYGNVYMWQWDDDFRAFAFESVAPQIAARLMGQDRVRLCYDQLFVKEPDTPAPTFWHHDLPYWPFKGEDIVSIWVALTDVSLENSGLEYIAGSHKWNKWFQAITPDQDPKFMDPRAERCPDYTDHANRRPEHRYLSWDIKAGDCICHHPLTVHGAGGNASKTQRRAALSIRYMGRDVRWDPHPTAMKVSGDPELAAGAYPADDKVFPVAWAEDKFAA